MHRGMVWALWASGALAAMALAGCSPEAPDTLRIGVLVPLTGNQSLRGKDLLDGAKLAADQINATTFKVNGKSVKIEIMSVDDKADPETAKKGAQALMDGGVSAIIGSLATPETSAVNPMITARGLPHLFTSTTATLLGAGGGNRFRLLASDSLQGRAMGVYAIQTLRAQRIATVVESGDFGRGLNKPFQTALLEGGKQVVVSVDVDTKGDVTADMARRIKTAQADLVVVLAREQQLKSLFKALSDVEYTDISVLGPNPVRNKNVATMNIPVRALYATATAIDANEFPAGKLFLTAFADKYKADPVWGAHYAYDAVYVLADAARRANSTKGPDLVAKLRAIEPQAPVNQQMRFDATGEQVYAGIAVYKAERGRWQPEMRSNAW
jgi:branched-chain amino acid transport system substrate-binding protein